MENLVCNEMEDDEIEDDEMEDDGMDDDGYLHVEVAEDEYAEIMEERVHNAILHCILYSTTTLLRIYNC